MADIDTADIKAKEAKMKPTREIAIPEKIIKKYSNLVSDYTSVKKYTN